MAVPEKTRGIVINFIKYSESSIIVKILTEQFGVQSYIIKGIFSKKGKQSLALFQPLNLLEIVASHKPVRGLHHPREIRVDYPYNSIPYDPEKRLLAIFLSEVLSRAVREEHSDQSMYNWMVNALTWFDLTQKSIVNFHLVFLIQLSRFLGFYPRLFKGKPYVAFDLMDGTFTNSIPPHTSFIRTEIATKLADLMGTSFEKSSNLRLTNKERIDLLEKLMIYYHLHLSGFGEIKSLEVLKEISN